MRTLLFVLYFCVIAITWTLQQLETRGLQAQVDGLHRKADGTDGLRRERDRVSALAASTGAVTALKRQAPAPHLRAQAPDESGPSSKAVTLTAGEWRGADTWNNRGTAHPIATMETALWAGAGGDVAALEKLLLLSSDVRMRAEKIFQQLPDSARANYRSPEQLVAAFTAKAIPLTEVQLIWHNQPSPDEATAGLLVRSPTVLNEPASPGQKEKVEVPAPPASPDRVDVRAKYFALRRTELGWQIIVPAQAVDRIAAELRGAD